MTQLHNYENFAAGDYAGFSWLPCSCCNNHLGGDRWEFYGLLVKDGRRQSENLGECCPDCLDVIS